MLQMLIKPLLGVAGDVVTGIVETKKKKAEVKLKKLMALDNIINLRLILLLQVVMLFGF